MRQSKADLKTKLMAQYSEAVDKLLEESEALEDFADLEEAVSQRAEQTLPQTLSTLLSSKDFSPCVPKLSAESSRQRL